MPPARRRGVFFEKLGVPYLKSYFAEADFVNLSRKSFRHESINDKGQGTAADENPKRQSPAGGVSGPECIQKAEAGHAKSWFCTKKAGQPIPPGLLPIC